MILFIAVTIALLHAVTVAVAAASSLNASFPLSYPTASICGGGYYDLSSIAGTELKYTVLENYYYLKVCGAVDVPACQSGRRLPSMLCDIYMGSGKPVIVNYASYNDSASVWSPSRGGVRLELDNGDLCSTGQPIVSQINFVCLATASTPYISNIQTTTDGCVILVTINTNVVCGTPSNLVCGPRQYNLSSLMYNDLVLTSGDYNYFLRPCAAVASVACAGIRTPSMLCQVALDTRISYDLGGPYNNSLAIWTPFAQGVTLYQARGSLCPQTNQNRQITINFVCNRFPNARFLGISEPKICVYNATVITPAACGSAAESIKRLKRALSEM